MSIKETLIQLLTGEDTDGEEEDMVNIVSKLQDEDHR